MGSYILYAAIMAIASFTLLQEVSCVGTFPANCGDFKEEIWNETFSNARTMEFTTFVFDTAKKLGTHEVCSDTYRSLFNYINMVATSETAHYTLKMLHKMISTVLTEATTQKGKFSATLTVLERIYTEKQVQNFVLFYVNEWLNLLKVTENRTKLFKLVKALETMTTPTKAELEVKEALKQVKKLVPFSKTK